MENHSVQLRELITKEEALCLQMEEDFDKKSEQIKGEVRYVIEKG